MAKEKAVIRSDMTMFQWTVNEMKKNKAGYFMVAPFFILFFIFTVVPVLLSFVLAHVRFFSVQTFGNVLIVFFSLFVFSHCFLVLLKAFVPIGNLFSMSQDYCLAQT